MPSDESTSTGAAASVAKRLKTKMLSLGEDIKAIRDKGRLAVDKPEHLTIFSGMYHVLDATYNKFVSSWDELLLHCESNQLTGFPTANDSTYLQKVKDYYYEANGLKIKIDESKPRVGPRFSANDTVALQSPRSILPQIKIRPFSGKFSEWANFKQLFVSLVIQEESLTDILRFHLLKSYLEGNPLELINNIELTEQNFTQAWNSLCNFYDNKRKIACGYIEQLLAFKPHSGKPSAESLQAFLSNVSESVISLTNLKIPNFQEYILCELALRGLDTSTRQAFELSMIGTEFPKFEQLKEFVNNRCHVMRLTEDAPSTSNSSADKPKVIPKPKSLPRPSGHALSTQGVNQERSSSKLDCYLCHNPHILRDCEQFKSSTPSQRLEALKGFPGCKNCLYISHKTNSCKSKFSCRFCNKRHHTYLHLGSTQTNNSPPSSPKPNSNGPSTNPSSSSDPSTKPSSTFCGTNVSSRSGVLLGTVRALLLDSNGRGHECRGILDAGSQFSFVVDSVARKLGLPVKPFRGHITGVNSSSLANTSGKVNLRLQPKSSTLQLSTEAVVVPSITPPLPQTDVTSEMFFDYQTYDLSDKTFNISQPISFLIGADLYPDVVSGVPIVLHEHGPRLIDTVFGFSVIGKYLCDPPTSTSEDSVACLSYLDFPIEKFWETEEPMPVSTLSKEDRDCEEHFIQTHYRVNGGRYGVRLPFKSGTPTIIPNVKVALNRFYSLENKLEKNEQLKIDYHSFMKEYLDLGHMSLAQSPPAYVIPHHPIYKHDLQGHGKLRVVFDASFVTTTGSLNDNLLTGPKLQSDIGNVVLNFRRFGFVLTCDIIKCFRQILVHPDDRKYQQIAWRFDPSESVKFYELNTVTYGLRSSPFHSQRVIRQLLDDEGEQFPLAAQALRDSIYVDDIPCGADSPTELFELKSQLINLLSRGGFELGKWSTNYPPLLGDSFPNQPVQSFNEQEDYSLKILGLAWDPRSDTFRYNFNKPKGEDFTKRNILSVIARLFDPLGYVAPVIFLAKTILQETWKSGVNWDEEIPKNLQLVWSRFLSDLPNISRISIPRHLSKTDSIYRLIGFSDASENGYGAALYLHSTQGSQGSMNLIKSKTKLAPLKTMTIPRLELQGALLLSRLVKSVKTLINQLNITSHLCFTDSQVVLAWLKTPVHELKTFVANRAQQITEIVPSDRWYHIKGAVNPADCASRGLLPSELLHHDLWWSGPTWCRQPIETWPITQEIPPIDVPELKPPKSAIALAAVGKTNDLITYMERHSSFLRLVRIFGYVNRFITNMKIPKCRSRRRRVGPISAFEFRQAHNTCVRLVQQHHYPEVFKNPTEGLSKDLSRLAAYIDQENIVRVGGRLSNAPLTLDHRHPILLPARSHFTDLVVDYLHRKNNHPGPAALLAFLRQQYWVPRARDLIRVHKMKCVTCTRYAKSLTAPIMGNLPTARLTGTRAFMNTGVDMAGPFICRDSDRRNAKTHKVWLCLFTCLASRAIHLELCHALSVESFLDAFDRFIARRGIPARVFSDCGTNFIGTARYLRENHDWILAEETQSSIIDRTSHLNVEWSFNPPASPHFGGSWESGIKLVKTLLSKTVGDNSYTSNELQTIFIKIEGILNSRPLLPLSTSPEDPEVLTPGHFTIGQPTNALPEPDYSDISPNRLNRWQLVRERVQHFWNRWRDEYLSSLQIRAKWEKKTPNLKIGDVVFVKNNVTSPTHWPIARIVAVHPGNDETVRVVTLKTAKGIFKRPVVNLIPLPINNTHRES